MAIAKFKRLTESGKSALIIVKANKFVFAGSPCYVPAGALNPEIKENEEFEIPDGYKLVDIVDIESGEVRTAKDGSPLKMLSY